MPGYCNLVSDFYGCIDLIGPDFLLIDLSMAGDTPVQVASFVEISFASDSTVGKKNKAVGLSLICN